MRAVPSAGALSAARAYHQERHAVRRAACEARRRERLVAVRQAIRELAPHEPTLRAVHLSMNETMLVLERSIREDLEAIERIFAALAPVKIERDTPQEECIVVGYRLHNLYNAFENVFRNIAHAFESSVDECGGWRVELLRRMRLDLMPIRPAVIDAATFDKLDELRRFRHVFRSLYTAEVDCLRMAVALDKARELRDVWPAHIEAFLRFVEGLRAAPLAKGAD